MKRRWTIKKHDREEVAKLSNSLKVSPIVAALLITRGYETEESAYKFLNPSYSDLHEPNLLKGMKEAVNRILKAVEKGEKILIWGDYDVDGTTGTVVLRKCLEILGAKTGFHIPHRFTEGYGLNKEHLERAKEKGYSLIISVDTGTRSFEPLAWAKENGLDVIVTDHHLSDEVLGNPDCVAMVNPNQTGDEYPDKNLAGVGVAFKLAHTLLREKGREKIVEGFLKVVAIGTIADVMKLTGENRAIVSIGLKDLPKAHNYGLRALMEVAECSKEMTSYHIGFRIAPRINAAGRMDAARHVVELFEAESFEKARELAEYLNNKNRERQRVQIDILEKALLEYVENGGSAKQAHFAVVAGDGWHRGVIGLAASKISEKLHRPSIVISLENGIGHGSARSISNYHLLNGMDSCAELFEQYGGHAAAAGMTIKRESIDKLREKLNEHAAENLSEDDLIPQIKIDALVSSQSLTLDLVEDLKRFEPFGMGNPKPVFVTRNLQLSDTPYVMKEKHLKLKLHDEKGKQFEAVWWDGVEHSREQTLKPQSRIELAYTPEANTWNNNTRLQLVVKDLKTV
ncbi:MAG: single-stranded-DNA-specific exonuclease RecJ [Acidobacteria bacterium]|jgi:single-stranded-DNA-specific exonuclease|nr:single-stranded-DNA-specific exonuclease RecJ [Acidobacteriota bacterium]